MCGFLDYLITNIFPCCGDKELIVDENTKLSSTLPAGDKFYELSLDDDDALSMTRHVVSLNGDTLDNDAVYQTLY